MKKYLFCCLLFSLFLNLQACFQNEFETYHGKIFATTYLVKTPKENKGKVTAKEIQNKLEELNQIFSVFDANSEISHLNKAEANTWITLSPALSYVLKQSFEIHHLSRGAFDPTVGALINLWGFGTQKISELPNPEKVQEALKQTGMKNVVFNKDFSEVMKLKNGLQFNLSAIAKGYVVDEIARLFEDKGVTSYLVEIGGEVKAKGNRDENEIGWNIEIENPLPNAENEPIVVKLQEMSVASSGEYKNYIQNHEKKYTHILSTKNGETIDNSLVAISVFDKDCLKADAYATAIFSMGEKAGIAFANQNKLPVMFFAKKGPFVALLRSDSLDELNLFPVK